MGRNTPRGWHTDEESKKSEQVHTGHVAMDVEGRTFYGDPAAGAATRLRGPGQPRSRGAHAETDPPDEDLKRQGFRLEWHFWTFALLMLGAGVALVVIA